MVEEGLSDLEIKLLNATLKFLKGTEDSMEFDKDNQTNQTSIALRSPDGKCIDYACIEYVGNAKTGDIKIYGMKYTPEKKNKYKMFLLKEVPEIKDRIIESSYF